MLRLDLSVHGDYYLPQQLLEGGESSLDINVLAPTYELLGKVSLERGKGAQMLRLDLSVHGDYYLPQRLLEGERAVLISMS